MSYTMHIDFETAARLAIENASKLLPNAKDFSLDGIILDNKENYEVSLSYILQQHDSLSNQTDNASLGALLKIMGSRREEKIFIISKDGQFKGFRNIK